MSAGAASHALRGIDLEAVVVAARDAGMDPSDAVVDAAADAYLAQWPDAALTEFTYHGARFLLDATEGVDRTVLAIGHPESPGQAREETYQRGFPIPETCAGRPLDRGHLLPYTAGGGYGPNLFAQDRALNRGWSSDGRRYRAMERKAITDAASSLFAVLLVYVDETLLPGYVQLIIIGPGRCESQVFRNRFDGVEGRERLAVELCGATDGQLGALGEEAVAVILDEEFDVTLVALGDAGMPREEGRQDLDLVAVVEGELVAFEVKTMYRSKRAGRLTRAGNLTRPRLRSTSTGRRQGSQGYVAERIEGIVDTGAGFEGVRVQVVVVDLVLMLAQFFEVGDQGTRLRPAGSPVPCERAVGVALERIRAHRGHL